MLGRFSRFPGVERWIAAGALIVAGHADGECRHPGGDPVTLIPRRMPKPSAATIGTGA